MNLSVKYIGAGRWAVTNEAGTAVGTLIQNSLQAWYAVDAAGVRLAVHGHREYGGPANPWTIANTMVTWAPEAAAAIEATAVLPAIATWAYSGNGYTNQEGHGFVWVGFTDDTATVYMFESIKEPGVHVAGVLDGGSRISTRAL